ncbi:MAG: B12-binding domain-containing radical SAM protein [Acidobacteriaceae bacterium]|nr:B12-binding domain-containing radical SAM protein [Acidobacteriaceae bacterium]
MIVLLHPRSTRPKNRRFPLAVLSLAAVLEGKEEYVIVDGNLDPDPGATLDRIMHQTGVTLLAVSVMPGPQMKAAIPLCRAFKEKYPAVPIVWGGYFASLYTDAALNAKYVDFVVRGQGEETLLELIETLRSNRKPTGVRGVSYRDDFGLHVHNAERPLRSPNDFPWLPYHRLPHVEKYIAATYLGRRTAVHQASIGCPYRCTFCGVVPIYQGRQRTEAPERTAAVLAYLQQTYNIDSVQFYDNNFFLNESHTADLAQRLIPLRLRWWTEGRIDAVLRYSDETLRLLQRSGAAMIFFGAESGSDWVLKQMNKHLTTGQTLELAARIRKFGIVPEFAFVIGNPLDPETDTRETIRFIRKIKQVNPDSEIIVQHYIPTPHPDGMYGNVDDKIEFPRTPDEWATDRWHNFTVRRDPNLAWLPRAVKRRIDNFDLVISSRWPTIQDIQLPRWGRAILKTLSSWRYALGFYAAPLELRYAQRLLALRNPRVESL